MPADRDPDRDQPPEPTRPVLKRREIFALIVATYKSSFPYFLLIVLVLVILTWVLTELVFVG